MLGGNHVFSGAPADRPVGAECAIGGRIPPLLHQPVLILSASAYQEGDSLVLAKTDVNDAMWISNLLACGLIRGSFVPCEKTQQLRTLLRGNRGKTGGTPGSVGSRQAG